MSLPPRRSLTGARIETQASRNRPTLPWLVAPSRERGSKRDDRPGDRRGRSRSLTGARIETAPGWSGRRGRRVAPSRERGSKRDQTHHGRLGVWSLPHGSADRNGIPEHCWLDNGRSLPHGSADRNDLRGSGQNHRWRSLPHGSADRNFANVLVINGVDCRSLTGARIETFTTSV